MNIGNVGAWALGCAYLTASPVAAQTVTGPQAASLDQNLDALTSGSVPRPEATPTPDEATDSTPAIVVTAKPRDSAGIARPAEGGAYSLTKSDYADVMTGTSALALVKNLPGVTFTSTDAYGLDLSDGFLLVRGFRQNEVAITFEGIPLNDGTYGSVTGTAPLNIGVTGDIGSVQISPGSAHVNTFSNSVNGGEVLYALVDPKLSPSLDAVLGYGSNNTILMSATAHTGQIGTSGPRALVGVERIAKDKYTSRGTQEALRANIKLVQDVPWGDFTAFFSFAKSRIWGYNNTSFDMLAKLGYAGTDILYPDYRRAIFVTSPENANLSCGAYTCGELAARIPYDTGQTTVDYVGNLTHHFHLSQKLSGSVMAYAAISTSDIEIADISTPSPTGVPFSALVWETRPQRFGGTANLSYATGRHMISAGLWIERISSSSRFASYNEPALGQGAPLRTIGPYDTYGPTFQIANASRWRTDSLQAYVQDVFKLTDDLTIRAGLKAVDFITSGGGIGPDRAPNGRLRAADPLLPQLSIDWRPNVRNSLYVDIAKTTIGYRVSSRGNIGPVSSAWAADSQQVFAAALPILKPEKDWNFTLGGYHDFGRLSIDLDVYYGVVLNRLLNGASGPQFSPVRSVGIVPRSELLGADGIVTFKVVPGLTISQSASVSKLRYRSDLVLPDKLVALNGHYQPGYPGMSLTTQVSVSHRRVEAGVTSTVYLDQPFTYTNDIYVPNYWQLNARASYHLPKSKYLPNIIVRFDVNNVLDRKQIGSVGIGGYSVAGDYQTFMRSAPRQFLFTTSARF